MQQEKEETEIQQLQRQLQEMVNQLTLIDPTIKIFPWFDKEKQITLENSKIPGDIKSINIYFPRLQPVRHGNSYGEMKISLTRRWEDIIYEMTDWLSARNHGLYYQALQCQTTTNLGWLLWSFRRIDMRILAKEIKSLTGANIQLRYQNISTGKGKSQSDNTVHALHVIANQQEADKVSNIFQTMYSFEQTAFPLGIVMRFIPHVFKVNSDKIPKIMKFRAHQDTGN
jgi:hypothetical protein